MRARSAGAALAVLALASGCGSMYDPRPPAGWLRPVEVEAWSPEGHGAWCTLRFATQPSRIEGELIAVAADSVFVLSPEGLVARPIPDLRRGALAVGRYSSGSTQVEWLGGSSWRRMATFARFPGGIPAGLDPRSLELKR